MKTPHPPLRLEALEDRSLPAVTINTAGAIVSPAPMTAVFSVSGDGVRWGQPVPGSFTSGLWYRGQTSAVEPGDEVPLGNVTYRNGVSRLGTNLTSLGVRVRIDAGAGAKALVVPFSITTTINTDGDARGSADTLHLLPAMGPLLISTPDGGMQLTITGFGPDRTSSWTIREKGAAAFTLWARLEPVDLPIQAWLAGNVLYVEGGPADERVQIEQSGGVVRVKGAVGDDSPVLLPIRIGPTSRYQIGIRGVAAVVARMREGNDSVRNETNLPGYLRGGEGDDTLIGGSARDSLFAGPGDFNILYGGGGDDRFLVLNNQAVLVDLKAEDARVNFLDGDVSWAPEQIDNVEGALAQAQRWTNNTRLLKWRGRPVTFLRASRIDGETLARNHNDGTIEVFTLAFIGRLRISTISHTILHELAHNWDEAAENPLWPRWVQTAGWKAWPSWHARWLPYPGYTRATIPPWYYPSRSPFVDPNYSNESPEEDFADTFASTILRQRTPVTGTAKEGWMRQWLGWQRTHP